MGRCAQWATAGRHGTPIGGVSPSDPPFNQRFPTFALLVSPFTPPTHHTQRFRGFETPRVGWEGGIWGRGERRMGRWAQWADEHLR